MASRPPADKKPSKEMTTFLTANRKSGWACDVCGVKGFDYCGPCRMLYCDMHHKACPHYAAFEREIRKTDHEARMAGYFEADWPI